MTEKKVYAICGMGLVFDSVVSPFVLWVQLVSPGAWLSDLCQERYEVREKKTSKKVFRYHLSLSFFILHSYLFDSLLHCLLLVLSKFLLKKFW